MNVVDGTPGARCQNSFLVSCARCRGCDCALVAPSPPRATFVSIGMRMLRGRLGMTDLSMKGLAYGAIAV